MFGRVGAELVQDERNDPAVPGRETQRLAFCRHGPTATTLEGFNRSFDQPLQLDFLSVVLENKVLGPRQSLQTAHERIAKRRRNDCGNVFSADGGR